VFFSCPAVSKNLFCPMSLFFPKTRYSRLPNILSSDPSFQSPRSSTISHIPHCSPLVATTFLFTPSFPPPSARATCLTQRQFCSLCLSLYRSGCRPDCPRSASPVTLLSAPRFSLPPAPGFLMFGVSPVSHTFWIFFCFSQIHPLFYWNLLLFRCF